MDKYISYKEQYAKYKSMIENVLDEISCIPSVPQASVYEAMRYSLMAGGKRIRPILTVFVTKMLGGDILSAIYTGAAIECIHTYSLIHDDLPCMDDDDLRRGMPTCHKKFSESTALLAGDGLLNKAFEILSGDEHITLDSGVRIKLIKTLSNASGVRGMIGGQVLDLEGEKKSNLMLDELKLMHEKKTGAMIAVSAELGALISGLSYENEREKYEKILEFSTKLGLAFQIKDDILDVTGDETVLGKPIGSDAEMGKNTFITLLGIDEAEKYLSSLTKEAVNALDIFGADAEPLRQLALDLLVREK